MTNAASSDSAALPIVSAVDNTKLAVKLDKSMLEKIPKVEIKGQTDYSQLSEYLISQEGDYVNGLFIMLQANHFLGRPLKPELKKTPIDIAFEDFFNDIDRRVVFFQHPPSPDSVFRVQPNYNIYPYFRELYDWQLTLPRSQVFLGPFVSNPQNFYSYCCHFFREMLGENASKFDLNEWCLSAGITNASDLISDAIFDAVDVQSYFEKELGILFLIIAKLPYRQQSQNNNESVGHYTEKPYVFENGFCVDIRRSKNSFSYKMEFRDVFLIESGKDSIRLQPIESICIHFSYPFGCSVIFNEQTLTFDGEKLVLMENGQKACYITTDGVWVSQKNGPVVIDQYGTIAQKIDDTWTAVTADSVTYVDGKQVHRKTSSIIDYKTKTVSMIRPDGIEYYVDNDGTRKILFNIDFSIEQRKTGITFDVPNFPLISFSNGSFTTQIDKFVFTFSRDKTVSFKCEGYSAFFDGEKVSVDLSDYKLDLTLSKCDVRSTSPTIDSHLISTADNANDDFKCSITSDELLKKYPIRLFAVRSDLTCVEFIRKDSELVEGAVFKSARIPHPYGGPVNVLVAHFNDLEKVPYAFIENAPIENIEEDDKNLNEVFKTTAPDYKVENGRRSFVSDCGVFARGLETYLDSEHEHFIRDNFEDSEEEDIVWPLPAQTPSPRLQMMQYNLYQAGINCMPNGAVLNYFKSHESDFALIDNEYEYVEEEEDENEDKEENDQSNGNCVNCGNNRNCNNNGNNRNCNNFENDGNCKNRKNLGNISNRIKRVNIRNKDNNEDESESSSDSVDRKEDEIKSISSSECEDDEDDDDGENDDNGNFNNQENNENGNDDNYNNNYNNNDDDDLNDFNEFDELSVGNAYENSNAENMNGNGGSRKLKRRNESKDDDGVECVVNQGLKSFEIMGPEIEYHDNQHVIFDLPPPSLQPPGEGNVE